MKLNRKKVHGIIRQKQKVEIKEIARDMKVSRQRVQRIWKYFMETGRVPVLGQNIITYLRNIGIQATRNKIPGAVGQVGESLAILVEKATEHKQYENIPLLAQSLGAIGIESATEKELVVVSAYLIGDLK